MNGFKAEYFSELAKLEEKNFWFKARNQLLIWTFKRHFKQANHFFEVGCGTGYVLSGINQSFPHLKLYGSELFKEGLEFATTRIQNASFFQMDARSIPFKNQFDVMGAFDVLEHIEEDENVLLQMHQAIQPNGGLIITVPQHPSLWSLQDEQACHVRRYTKKELISKVTRAGFSIVETLSFMSFLLPLMVMSRKLKNVKKNQDALAELKLHPFINFGLEKILDLERLLIKSRMRFPAGGSLLLVAKKT